MQRAKRHGLIACLTGIAASMTMVFPAGASAVTPQAAVDGLNALRSASGLPTVALDGAMSAGCEAHNAYMERNRTLSHQEIPQNPGYTPEGDAAGRAGILSSGGSGRIPEVDARMWATIWAQPWYLAPWHEAFMLNPAVTRIGYADSHGFHCLTAAKGRTVAPGETYSFPASGMTDVPLGGTTSEEPAPPQDVVGFPREAVGFNILLWHSLPRGAMDPWELDGGGYNSAVVSATLNGPDGQRPVSVVPARSPSNPRDVNVVVPHAPYKSNSRYTLDVVFDDGTPYRVTFTTGHFTPPSYEMVVREGNEIGVSVVGVTFYEDTGAIEGPLPEAVLTRPDGTTQALPNVALEADSLGDAWRGKITVPGRYTVCATFGEEPPHCQSLDTTKPHLVCTTTGPGQSACRNDPGSGRGAGAAPAPGAGSTATVRDALQGLLGQRPSHRSLARHGKTRLTFVAPGPGRLLVDWYQGRRKARDVSRRRRLAHGRLLVRAGGKQTIKVTLSRQGRVRIRSGNRLKVTARAMFTPRGGRPTVASRTFAIGR